MFYIVCQLIFLHLYFCMKYLVTYKTNKANIIKLCASESRWFKIDIMYFIALLEYLQSIIADTI